MYKLGLQFGLTDEEVRKALAMTGNTKGANEDFWISNWNAQSNAINGWVNSSGQDADTSTFLYEQNQKIFNGYKEAADAVRGSGAAQAQGQVQQIELLQSIDKRLAEQSSDARMGAVA